MSRTFALLVSCCLTAPAGAADALVAVAANFTGPMNAIVAQFERVSGHQVRVAYGSSGKIYGQITHGAPFHAFLSADQATPVALQDENQVVPGSRFTYAIGTLALWSADPAYVGRHEALLGAGRFKHLAIANPKLAPYGRAALQALRALGLEEQTRAKLVQGESIAQAYQFVATGNAELGFIALSQITVDGHTPQGSAWIVPRHLYEPIRQDAVLLRRGLDNAAANALLGFLRGPEVAAIVASYGYLVEAPTTQPR